MSPGNYPPWSRWPPRGRTSPVNPNLRISDADRNEATERLSKHYGDGRLDQAEFNERLEAVMKAKTHADLAGLFDDLPAPEPTGPEAPPRPHHHPHPRRPRLIGLVLLIIVCVIVARGLIHAGLWWFGFPFFIPIPWLVIGLVLFLCLRRRPGRRW